MRNLLKDKRARILVSIGAPLCVVLVVAFFGLRNLVMEYRAQRGASVFVGNVPGWTSQNLLDSPHPDSAEFTGPFDYVWQDCRSLKAKGCSIPSSTDKWKSFDFPEAPPLGAPNEEHLWLQLRIPKTNVGVPSIHLDGVAGSFSVFLEGKLIYEFGGINTPDVVEWRGLHLFQLPENSPGKLLQIRVYMPKYKSYPKLLFYKPKVKNISYASFTENVSTQIRKDFQRLVTSVITIFLGVVQLGFFVAWRRNRLFLTSGLFAFFIGLYMMMRTKFPYLLGLDAVVGGRTEFLALYIASAAMGWVVCLVMSSLVSFAVRLPTYILVGILTFEAVLGSLGAATGAFPAAIILFSFQMTTLMALPVSISTLAFDALRGNREARVLLIGYALFAFFAALDITNSLQLSRFSEGTSVTHWGMLLFALSIVAILMVRYLETYRHERRLAHALERVVTSTRELVGLLDSVAMVRCALGHMTAELAQQNIQEELVLLCTGEKSEFETLLFRHGGRRVEPKSGQRDMMDVPTDRSEPWWEGETNLWIPIRNGDKFLGAILLSPVYKNSVSAENSKAIDLLSRALALSLENMRQQENLRAADRREMAREAAFLNERIAMATDLSDRLNSPLLVAVNSSRMLEAALSETMRINPGLCRESGLEFLKEEWDKKFPHLTGAIQSILELSRQLSALREGPKQSYGGGDGTVREKRDSER